MALTLTINGTSRTANFDRDEEVSIDWPAGDRATLRCSVRDTDSTASAYRPSVGQSIVLANGATTVFSGTILSVKDLPVAPPARGTLTQIDAVDLTEKCDRVRVTATYTAGQTLKTIVTSLVTTYLSGAGITVDAGMASGPTLQLQQFDNATVTDCLNHLATVTSYVWRIKPDGTLEFFSVGTKTASYSLTNSNGNTIGPIPWSKTRGAYANRIILKAGTNTVVDKTDSFTTTLGQTSWTLTYPIATATGRGYITVNGVNTPVGIFGVNSTTYTIDKASNTIRRTSAPTVGTVITITYPAQFPITVQADDSTLQASDGVYTGLFDAPEVFDKSAATELAAGLLATNKVTPQIVTAQTRAGIVYPGDVITLTFSARTVSGSYLISNVGIIVDGDGNLRYTLTCVSGTQNPASWLDYFRMLGGSAPSTVGGTVSGSVVPNTTGHFADEVSANSDTPNFGVTMRTWADSSAANGGSIVFNGADENTKSWAIVADTLQASASDLQFIIPADASSYGWVMNLTQAQVPVAGNYWLLGPTGLGKLHLGDYLGGPSGWTTNPIGTITCDTIILGGATIGVRTPVAFSAGNFTASAGTWTVGSGDQIGFGWTMLGPKVMRVDLYLSTTSTSAGMGTSLKVTLPNGATVGGSDWTAGPVYLNLNGTYEWGEVIATPGNTFLTVFRLNPTSAFTSGLTNTLDVRFEKNVDIA